jgi:hypothetical protein
MTYRWGRSHQWRKCRWTWRQSTHSSCCVDKRLNGQSYQIIFVWKWYQWVGLTEDVQCWSFKFLRNPWIFMDHWSSQTTQFEFLLSQVFFGRYLALTQAVFRLPLSPRAAGGALDVEGRQEVLLFHHINIGGVLLLRVGSAKCDISYFPITPWAFSAVIGNHEEGTHSTNG